MDDVIVILHANAIAAAQQVGAGLPDYAVYLFDPVLGDPVAAAGLRNVELFTALGGPSYHAMDNSAHAAALALETELDQMQRAQSGISIIGWQHLNLYYLSLTLQWYGALWERLGPQLQQRRVHVLINDNPADYYFDSFLPSLLLVGYLQKHGIAFNAYCYGARGAPVYAVPDLAGYTSDEGPNCLLTHLPTCLYDIDYFCDEMRAAGKRLINFEAKHWNLPIEASRQIGLIDVEKALVGLTPTMQVQLNVITEAARERLGQLLRPHIGLPIYCARQVDHIVQLYRSQLVTYFELQRFFRDAVPEKLLLSDHDTGFHGPLIGFAEQRSLPVILLPHSKVSSDIDFSYHNILILTHPMQGRPIHNTDRRSVSHLSISFPEHFTCASGVGNGLRTVSLMLNALSLNGIPYAPSDIYLDGIKRIVTWCRANDVNIKIRCKPSYSIFRLLSAVVGAEIQTLMRSMNETLDVHATDCDSCLMYDIPTTGAMYFLRNSIPILNPVVTVPTTAFMAIVHSDVIATESVDATLLRMERFKSDPSTLYAFRTAQFEAYRAQFQRARALRTYL
jgi:hypothetical protein